MACGMRHYRKAVRCISVVAGLQDSKDLLGVLLLEIHQGGEHYARNRVSNTSICKDSCEDLARTIARFKHAAAFARYQASRAASKEETLLEGRGVLERGI